MQKKLSYITFFPSDWLSDIHLHQCSLEARGVWIDMLCIMAKGRKYGFLVNGDGKAFSLDKLASLIRINTRKLESCLAELEREGIFKRDEEGIIYSKRLVEDAQRILEHREGSRERMQRYRQRAAADKPSAKHSCESPASSTQPWEIFIEKGYGKSRSDWESAGRPSGGEIQRFESGVDPWPENYNWKEGKPL